MNRFVTTQQAREALEAQGFKAPGPKLIQRVADTLEQADDAPAGERRYQFDYAEVLADTPELIDRTDGPMTDPGTETSYALAEVLNKAYTYVSEYSDGRGG